MPERYSNWAVLYGISADPLAISFIEAIDNKRAKLRFLMVKLFQIPVVEAVRRELFLWNLYLTMTRGERRTSAEDFTGFNVDTE